MSLVSTWIPRIVEVRVLVGDGRYAHLGSYRVRPATAQEGISIMETFQMAIAGDEDAWEVIRHVIHGWLPLRLATQLTAQRFKRVNAIRVAVGLLGVGVQNRRQYETDKKKVDQAAADLGWDTVVREYRHLMSGTLQEPWPFFLSQAAGIDELRARNEVSFMRSYGASRASEAGPRQNVFRRAGFGEDWSKMSKAEKQQRVQEGLDRLAAIHRMNQGNPRA